MKTVEIALFIRFFLLTIFIFLPSLNANIKAVKSLQLSPSLEFALTLLLVPFAAFVTYSLSRVLEWTYKNK